MNRGVVEIGLGDCNRCLLLLHLGRRLGDGCLRCGNSRISRIRVGFRQIQLLLAHHALLR